MKRLVFRYISVFLLLVAVAGSGKGILYAQPSGMPAEDIHQEESFNAGAPEGPLTAGSAVMTA